MVGAAGRVVLACSAGLSVVLALAPAAARVHADEAPPVAPPADRAAVHVVAAGDTLWQIAADAGTDVATLVKLNGLDDPNRLALGQSLRLGAAPPRTAPAVHSYTVAAGDTLWAIAQQFSTTTVALVSANGLQDADRLAIGAQLTIPAGEASDGGAAGARPSRGGSPPAGTSAAGQGGGGGAGTSPSRGDPGASVVAGPGHSVLVSYTVQPGETLNHIAQQFQVGALAIAQASELDNPNRIVAGSVLKVPLPGREHVVKAGETLRDIALQEKVDLGSLIDFNAIDDPELIHIGQVVVVPVPATMPSAQVAAVAASAPSAPPARPAAPAAAAPGQAVAPAPAATDKPATQATATSAVAATARPTTAAPNARPAAPVAVVAPPRGAPSDGLAGAALKLLGAPYVWGGSSPSGFDCSGLVWYVSRQIGKPLSRGMFGEYNSGSHPAREDLKPGDLVFFQNTYTPGLSHNGVYIGNNQFVHAADEAAGVTISSLTTAYWSSHWFGATRLP